MRIKSIFKYFREYGFKCSLAVILSQLFPFKGKKGKLSWNLLQYKHKTLLDYLTHHYWPVTFDLEVKPKKELRFKDCIWTLWLQGEENAPESIRMTLASMRKFSNGHQVVVLTNETIDQYIEIPSKIKEKHCKGLICNANYSDIIRAMLLSTYGGLWLDATMMLHEPIDESLFLKDFYSVGSPDIKPSSFVSAHKWIAGIIGGSLDSKYLHQLSVMLNAYWYEHEISIDYLAFDYIIAVLYQNDAMFAKTVDALPRMPFLGTSLRSILNAPYDENTLNQLLVKGQIFIVTYKQNYIKETPTGQETVYGHFCKLFLNEVQK